MKNKKSRALKQCEFCNELMKRLNESVHNNIDMTSQWDEIYNHSQLSNDVIRLRRELNDLRKILLEYSY